MAAYGMVSGKSLFGDGFRLSSSQMVALALILVVGGALRFYGLSWGLPGHFIRDEAEVAEAADSMAQTVLERRGLGPELSAGRALPSWVSLALAPLVRLGARVGGTDLLRHDELVLAGRITNAVADVGSIFLVFLLGTLANTATGLWGAALYAVALVAVRQAHFATPDSLTTLLALLYVYFCSGLPRASTRLRYTLAGVSLGLLLSVQLVGILLLPVALLGFWLQVKVAMVSGGDHRPFMMKRCAGYLRVGLSIFIFLSLLPVAVWALAGNSIQGLAKTSLTEHLGEGRVMAHSADFWSSQIEAVYRGGLILLSLSAALCVGGALLALVGISHHRGPRASYEVYARLPRLGHFAVGCVAAFLLLNPDSIVRPLVFWAPTGPGHLTWEILAATGVVRPLPAWLLQFEGTWPGWFHLHQVLPYAWGPPLAVLLLTGLIWAAVAATRREAGTLWAVVTAALIAVAALLACWNKETRHILSLTALLSVCAGYLLASLSGAPVARLRGVGVLGGLLACGLSLAWCVGYVGIYGRPTTRSQALDWLREHARDTKRLRYEWDDSWTPQCERELAELFGDRRLRYNPATRMLTSSGDPLDAEVLTEKQAYLREALSGADCLLLANGNLRRISRLPDQFPLVSAFYDRLLAGKSNLRLVATVRSQPKFLFWPVDDSNAELSFLIQDHPTIYIFRDGRPDASGKGPAESRPGAAKSASARSDAP